MHVIRRCHSQVLGVIRRYYVGVVRRYAPAFSTTTSNCRTLCTRSIRRPFQNLSDARTRLPRTLVRASVDAHSCICQMPVPVSVRTGVGWKLYYNAYRIYCVILHWNYSFLFSVRSTSISEHTDVLSHLTKQITPSCFDFCRAICPAQRPYCTCSTPVPYRVPFSFPYQCDGRRILNFYQMYLKLFSDLSNRIRTTPFYCMGDV